MLTFRDRLRTRDDERIRYEDTKRELASRAWTYVQYYADAKGEVVEGIIARAFADRDNADPQRRPSLTASAAIDTVRERT